MLIDNPKVILHFLVWKGFFDFLSDEEKLKLIWKVYTDKPLNLDNPQGFNEKLNWLKLYDRKDIYTIMSDKYEVRKYIKETIGGKYLIPLIGVYDDPEEIDFDKLPDSFVIKWNHNSGQGMCLCKDKDGLDKKSVINSLKKARNYRYYEKSLEWPYKNIKPKIVIEEFIEDKSEKNKSGTLIDYKFYCFNGEPRFLYVGTDDITGGKKGEARLTFLNMNWGPVQFYREDHRQIGFDVDKPDKFDEMVEISRKLSKDIPFVRVDLYCVNDRILFSEMTFFPGGGYGFFNPEEWERKIGDLIILPEKVK